MNFPLFFIAVFLFQPLYLSAQHTFKTPIPTGVFARVEGSGPSHKAVTDTLHSDFLQDQITLYASPNGGFLSGNSGFNEYAKVQEFQVDSAIGLSGFLFWFAYKAQFSNPQDSSRLVLVWYDMDTAGVVADSSRLIPNRLLAADTLFLSQIDTSSNFDASVYLWEPQGDLSIRNFAAGIVMDLLHPSDTVALWSSSDGDPNRPFTSWERYLGEWSTIHHNWGVDVGLSVLALVDRFAGLDAPTSTPIRMGPNPTNDYLELRLKASISKPKVEIFNAEGKSMLQFGDLFPGNSFLLDLSQLSSGVYILVLSDGNRPLHAGRFCKQ